MKVLRAFLLLAALVVPGGAQTGYVNGQAARGELGQPIFFGGYGNTYAGGTAGTTQQITSTLQGVAASSNRLFVADSSILVPQGPGNNNRVLIFDSTQIPGPDQDLIGLQPNRCPLCFFSAINVLGQPNYTTATQATTVGANTLNIPTAVATDGTRLAIADTNNNRVLLYNEIPTSIQQPADIVLGQTNFTTVAPDSTVNASTLSGPQGVWIYNGKLFVADTQNSRVLIWNQFPTSNNQPADVVLGEPNFNTRYVAPASGPVAAANTLYDPVSVTTDGTHLFVADLGDHRVLIWNEIPTTNQAPADVVLGQPNMTMAYGNNSNNLCPSNGTTASGTLTYPALCANTMSYPRFALSDGIRLYVADGGNDRVLVYKSVPTVSNTTPDNVLGQPDFNSDVVSNETQLITSTTVSNASSADTIRTPTSLAWDGTNLYVADPFDFRVLYFTPGDSNLLLPNSAVLNAASLQIHAEGFVVIGGTVTAGNTVTITISGQAYTYTLVSGDTLQTVVTNLIKVINNSNSGAGNPNAIAHDAGNHTVALQAIAAGAAGNNVTLSTSTSSSASITATASGIALTGGNGATIAPGTLVVINAPSGVNFSPDNMSHINNDTPLDLSYAGIEVYVDGIPCPIAYVNPDQIRVQIPFQLYSYALAQSTNSASLYVRKVNADGSISSSNAIPLIIVNANPGIFSLNDGSPPTVMAFHASDHATAVVSVDGSVTAGNTATVTVGSNSYTYTVQASDTLATIQAALAAMINNDPLVTAAPSGQFNRITLTARVAGLPGTGIPIKSSVSSGAAVIVTVFNPTTCCVNTAGAPVTQANPAVPNELIDIYGTGLGILGDSVKVQEGYPYTGPQPNSAQATVSATMGGTTSQVLTAGFQPGAIGIYQVELQVPSNATTNNDTQLYIAQNAYISNIVTIPIAAGGATQFTISPNPIPVSPGVTTGTTTLYYQSADPVNIYVGAGGTLLCSGAAGSGSCQTGNWVKEGMTFYLVDTTNGATLAQQTAHLGSAQATLTANPNPIVDLTGNGLGVTTITVSANVLVNVYAGSTVFCGPLMTGTCTTGDWVQNGTVFTAVQQGTTNVLTTLIVNVRPPSATVTISSVGDDGSGYGVATVSFVSDVPANLWVGGTEFCAPSATTGTCTTGKWVTQGMVFKAVDPATGKVLGSAAAQLVPPSGTVTVTPNPIVAPDSSGNAYAVIKVSSNISAAVYVGTTLLCNVPIGSSSCDTGRWVKNGMVFKLVDPYNGHVFATGAANVVPPSATITLSPNPIVPDSTGLGNTVVYASATVPVDIYAGSTIMCSLPTGSGSCSTGQWVANGSVFTPVNHNDNHALATVTAQVLPLASTPAGVMTLMPNPIVPNDSGLGVTVVQVTTNVPANVYVGNSMFCQAPPGYTACQTGQWVVNGLTFTLVATANNQTLATATAQVLPPPTTPTATLTLSPNPITADSSGFGTTSVSYTSNVPININVGSAVLCSVAAGSGTCQTGDWVTNGTVFKALDTANNAALASVTAIVN